MDIHIFQFFVFLDVGDCYSNPCFGSSTCVPEENLGYSCICRDGIIGTNCDEAEFDGFKYHAFDELKMWEDARSDCSIKGLVLASILSQDAHELLVNFVQ